MTSVPPAGGRADKFSCDFFAVAWGNILSCVCKNIISHKTDHNLRILDVVEKEPRDRAVGVDVAVVNRQR